LGIEEAGVEIEDPFGHDDNDLPLNSICDVIHRDVRALLCSYHPDNLDQIPRIDLQKIDDFVRN
jgi:predicted membrane chloride channel (bestrophin family)